MSRYAQCDTTCTTDCGHCKGNGPADGLFIAPDADGFPVVWRRNEFAPDRPQMVAQKWGTDAQIWAILAAAIPAVDA